jgi:DNA-binding MarR family transcriptional regulator
MSSHNKTPQEPRAVIHKKILDAARSHPDASVEELANIVQGASINLVSRVLDDYGDPKENNQSTEPAESSTEHSSSMSHKSSNGTSSGGDTDQVSKERAQLEELTEKQLEVLHGIRKQPDASQRDLADDFDVGQSTINNRLNSIDGFTWEDRAEFVESLFGTETDASRRSATPPQSRAVQSLEDQVSALTEQISSFSEQRQAASGDTQSPFCDPDLAYKIVRACRKDGNITEDEQNRILKAAITYSNSSA